MTTAINTSINVPQGAMSVPLSMGVAEKLFTFGLQTTHDAGNGSMAAPMFDAGKDGRQNNIAVMDIVATLTEKASNEFSVPQANPAGMPFVTANVNGIPHAKRDFTLFLMGSEKDKESEIKLQRLVKKFSYAGVARSGYNSPTGPTQGAADQLISVDTHCYSGINVEVTEEIPNFTPVRLFVPKYTKNGKLASQDSIGRQIFGITPIDTQSVSDYVAGCLQLYVNGGIKGRIISSEDSTTTEAPISFYNIRDSEIYSDVVISDDASTGHRIALGCVGLAIKSLSDLLVGGYLYAENDRTIAFTSTPNNETLTTGQNSAHKVIKELSEFVGLVQTDAGTAHSQLEGGFKLLSTLMEGKMSNDHHGYEIGNICNNALHTIMSTVAEVVHQDFRRIGVLYRLGPYTDHANRNKRLAEGLWSSLQ